MRLILLGPPGSGKGTQARLLSERLGLEHIGTGDILREAIRLQTPTGKKAEPFVRKGHLVPDTMVNDLIAERFHREDRPDKFVLDGYPRTLAQGNAFDQVLRQAFLNLEAVLFIRVDDEQIVRRLSGRWSCPNCKSTYHMVNNPPKVVGVCDVCGNKLIQRQDDREETVRERLRLYHANTVDLIPHYRAQGLLHEVSGDGGIEQVYERITKELHHQAGPSC
jgi:adenylate kinase